MSTISIRSCRKTNGQVYFCPLERCAHPFLYTHLFLRVPRRPFTLFLFSTAVAGFGSPPRSCKQLEQASRTPLTHFPFKDGTNCPKLPTLPLHFLLAYLRLLLCISVSLYPHIDCIPKARRNQANFPRDRDDHPKDSYVRTPRCLWTLPIAHPVCSI